MHRGSDPIIKYIEDNASEGSHCLRGDKYGKGKKNENKLCGIGLQLGVLMGTHVFNL